MPAFLIALAARLGVAQRFQKLAAWVMVLVAAAALLWGARALWRAFWAHHDAQVVTSHDAATTIDALNATVAADRGAGANQQARDVANGNEQQRLRQAHDQAVSNGDDAWDAISNQLQ